MNDRTDDTAPAADNDHISITRPEWMPADEWADIRAKLDDKVDELLDLAEHDPVRRAVADSPVGGCTERPWCHLGPVEEHRQEHAGPPVDLADYDAATDRGWWCHAHESRVDGRVILTFEGHWLDADEQRTSYDFDVSAAQMVMLQWATSTPAAEASLAELLDLIAQGER